MAPLLAAGHIDGRVTIHRYTYDVGIPDESITQRKEVRLVGNAMSSVKGEEFCWGCSIQVVWHRPPATAVQLYMLHERSAEEYKKRLLQVQSFGAKCTVILAVKVVDLFCWCNSTSIDPCDI
eukprot:968778-Pelagomonas_calceolata.AAC.1